MQQMANQAIVVTREQLRARGEYGVPLCTIDIVDEATGKVARVWVQAFDLGRGAPKVEMSYEQYARIASPAGTLRVSTVTRTVRPWPRP